MIRLQLPCDQVLFKSVDHLRNPLVQRGLKGSTTSPNSSSPYWEENFRVLTTLYRPVPEDILLRAFEVLDQNKCGHLTKDELVKYMTEEGEPFTQEEMEEMLSAAVDPETNTVRYKDYISMMVVDEN
ncbi:hypothetical protein JD844_024929 [Phrynosoma platyrhinos]|uniref:EF-hand domain-containing protein n=1 Tax=Phrynosoma platyrhinos TaxID=52577 RepID=A0ABQ7SYR8_PHRPL|nr:hypothetical protein JD844_024929 [Phrynosoma platyrhinos]